MLPLFAQGLEHPRPVRRIGFRAVQLVLVLAYVPVAIDTHACENADHALVGYVVESDHLLELCGIESDRDVLAVLPLVVRPVKLREILEGNKLPDRSRRPVLQSAQTWAGMDDSSLGDCRLLLHHLLLLLLLLLLLHYLLLLIWGMRLLVNNDLLLLWALALDLRQMCLRLLALLNRRLCDLVVGGRGGVLP